MYDGSTLDFGTLLEEGKITVTDSRDSTKVLKNNEDFTVACTSSLRDAGTVKFTVTGMGEYTGSVSKSFKISPLKVSDKNKFAVTFDRDKTYEYKASGTQVDKFEVRYLGAKDSDTDDQILKQGVDYKITYSNNKKVSTASKKASLKINFIGNYKGSKALTEEFMVGTAKLSARNTTVIVPDKVYGKAGKSYKSTPVVSVDGAAIKTSEYSVSYRWATKSEEENDDKYVPGTNVTIADRDDYARVKVTVTLKEQGRYAPADGETIEGEYFVRKADNAINISKVQVTFHLQNGNQVRSLKYNGGTYYTPEGNDPNKGNVLNNPNAVYVRVYAGKREIDASTYDVTWTNAKEKGSATVVISANGKTGSDGTVVVGSMTKKIRISAMSLKGSSLRYYLDNAISALKDMFF